MTGAWKSMFEASKDMQPSHKAKMWHLSNTLGLTNWEENVFAEFSWNSPWCGATTKSFKCRWTLGSPPERFFKKEELKSSEECYNGTTVIHFNLVSKRWGWMTFPELSLPCFFVIYNTLEEELNEGKNRLLFALSVFTEVAMQGFCTPLRLRLKNGELIITSDEKQSYYTHGSSCCQPWHSVGQRLLLMDRAPNWLKENQTILLLSL